MLRLEVTRGYYDPKTNEHVLIRASAIRSVVRSWIRPSLDYLLLTSGEAREKYAEHETKVEGKREARERHRERMIEKKIWIPDIHDSLLSDLDITESLSPILDLGRIDGCEVGVDGDKSFRVPLPFAELAALIQRELELEAIRQ